MPENANDLSGETWGRVGDLMVEALGQPPDRRSEFLEKACGGQLWFLRQVESLLESHRMAEGVLDQKLSGAAIHALAETDPDEEAGEEIGPYRLLRVLGQGGMGVVWVAEDTRLERRVALKFLPPHLAADSEARRRLLLEARAAAALDHPNVGVVHEVGEAADGRAFIAMAYYEGRTLQELIADGPIAIGDVLDLAQQVASGLAEAHRVGCVHRDIKPSNVVVAGFPERALAECTARIVDFGVARLPGADLSDFGRTPGTIAYMSPEQTRGDLAGPASDVWSLGVLLYEMLAGTKPFRGENDRDLIHAIRHDEPRPLPGLRPDAPGSFVRIVERCLRKNPSRRYPDSRAVATGLQGEGESPSSMVSRAGVARAGGAPLRISVLPLESVGGESGDQYLAAGMTAELISRLTRLRSVQVIGRTASPYGRSPEQGISGAARALGVSALLEGSLYKSADSIRLVARLVDADSELHIWSGEFDASVADVLSVQQNVARQVVEALNVELLGEEQARFDRRATSNREAYQIYLRARYLIDQFDPVSVGRARDLFEQALDLDPAFPEAWAGLADAYRTLEYIGLLGPRDAGPRGKAAAQRALALDPGLAAAHTALATVVFDYDRDPETALEHYQQAIALEPDYATGRQFYAEFLRDMGRFDEALAEIHRAQELDPLSPFYRLVEGIILHMARRAPEAIGVFERLLALDPRFQPTRFHLALACAQTGDLGRALEELDRFDPNLGIPDVIAVRGGLFAAMGRTDEVRRMQALLDQTRAPVSAFSRAIVHIGMGEVETALDLIEKAVEDRSWFVRLLRVEPGLDMLRAHPRFRTLLGNR